jgi:excisionase family DNA binding protein
MPDDVLTVDQVAAQLGVSAQTVRAWLRTGALRGSRLGGTRAGWRIQERDVTRYLDGTANRPAAAEA